MVNIPKFFKNQEMETSGEMLPLLPLRDIVVFPHMVAPLFVGRNKSVSALSSAMNKDKRIFLATQRNVPKSQGRLRRKKGGLGLSVFRSAGSPTH